MTIIKFVIRHGGVASQDTISLSALDVGLLGGARDVLAHLREGKLSVSLSWSDGTEDIVGLGLPPLFQPHVERFSEALPETWEAGREARDRKLKGTAFYVTTSGETELYSLAREAAIFDVSSPWNLSSASTSQVDITNLAGLYGAVAGSCGLVEKRRPANERDLRPSTERIQQFWEVATQIVAAAPAFMCNGRLNGAAAAFADCFAIAMLSDPDASAARTTAA
jgi:hypothetical protein